MIVQIVIQVISEKYQSCFYCHYDYLSDGGAVFSVWMTLTFCDTYIGTLTISSATRSFLIIMLIQHSTDQILEQAILIDTVMRSILSLMTVFAFNISSHAQPTAVSCNPYRLIEYLAENGIYYQITHEAEIGKSVLITNKGRSSKEPQKIETYILMKLPQNARSIKVYKYYQSTEPCQLPSYFSAPSSSEQDRKSRCWATKSSEIKDGYMEDEVIDYHWNSKIKVTVKMGNTSLCGSRKCLMVVSYNLKN